MKAVLRQQGLIFLVLLLTGLYSSCGKEKDISKPTVIVSSPAVGTTINVPDSVKVVVDIFDDRIIEIVRVGLVNADRISVSQPVYFFPLQHYATLDFFLHIEDKQLGSGDYFILIHVSDGINTRSEYIPVLLNEVPREVAGYLVIGQLNAMSTSLDYLDASFLPDTSLIVAQPFAHAAVGNLDELLFFAAPQPSTLSAFPLRSNEAEWTVAAALPYPVFTGLWFDNEIITGTANGDVFVYTAAGAVKVKTLPVMDRKVKALAADEDYIVCELISINGAEHFLYNYYRVTGGLNSYRKVAGDISAIVPMGKRFLIVLQGDEGAGIYTLEPEESGLTLERILAGKTVNQAVRIDEERVLLGTGTEIFIYDLWNNSLTFFLGFQADGMVFEPLQSLLFCFKGKKVSVVSYPEGEALWEQEFLDQIVDFQCIYTR